MSFPHTILWLFKNWFFRGLKTIDYSYLITSCSSNMHNPYYMLFTQQPHIIEWWSDLAWSEKIIFSDHTNNTNNTTGVITSIPTSITYFADNSNNKILLSNQPTVGWGSLCPPFQHRFPHYRSLISLTLSSHLLIYPHQSTQYWPLRPTGFPIIWRVPSLTPQILHNHQPNEVYRVYPIAPLL